MAQSASCCIQVRESTCGAMATTTKAVCRSSFKQNNATAVELNSQAPVPEAIGKKIKCMGRAFGAQMD